MRLWAYFLLSAGAALAQVIYAVRTREQFASIMIYLVSSKTAVVVLLNLSISVALLVGSAIRAVFLGELRPTEVENLVEKLKYYLVDFIFILGFFHVSLEMQSYGFVALQLALRVFHWLAQHRLQVFEQVHPTSTWPIVKLSLLLLALLLSDLATLKYIQDSSSTSSSFFSSFITLSSSGPLILLYFQFEQSLLLFLSIYLLLKLSIYILDYRLESGFNQKELFSPIIDLIYECLKLLSSIRFALTVYLRDQMPLFLLRETLTLAMNVSSKFQSLLKYIYLSKNIDERFEDASEEDLSSCEDCIICRESIEEGKRLPCGHVFHKHCLKSWIAHQQVCPLCR